MIVFYNLKTGIIEGTIEGRIHDEGQLKMWVGNPNETGRIICQWKPTGKKTVSIVEEPIYTEVIGDEGYWETRQTGTKKRELVNIEFEPELQKDIFIALDDKAEKISDYKVNIETGMLERI